MTESMTFRQYMLLDDEIREAMFDAWCRENKRSPNDDQAGDDFLDAITANATE